jgi:hypothetical protein
MRDARASGRVHGSRASTVRAAGAAGAGDDGGGRCHPDFAPALGLDPREAKYPGPRIEKSAAPAAPGSGSRAACPGLRAGALGRDDSRVRGRMVAAGMLGLGRIMLARCWDDVGQRGSYSVRLPLTLTLSPRWRRLWHDSRSAGRGKLIPGPLRVWHPALASVHEGALLEGVSSRIASRGPPRNALDPECPLGVTPAGSFWSAHPGFLRRQRRRSAPFLPRAGVHSASAPLAFPCPRAETLRGKRCWE